MDYHDDRKRQALRQHFAVFADLLLTDGVDAPTLLHEAKIGFVKAARENHGRNGKPASINRISELTGMSRKHVKQLLDEASQLQWSDEIAAPFEADVVAKWVTSEEYLDESGHPRPLPLDGEPPSFKSLVIDALGQDISEWLYQRLSESDAIRQMPDKSVESTRRVFSIADDLPRLIASMLTPLVTTMRDNWRERQAGRFVLRVAHHTHIDSSKIPALRRMSKDRARRYLEEFDDLLMSFETDDSAKMTSPEGHELSRVGLVTYYFEIGKKN